MGKAVGVRASARKKVLVINTNSGGHAVIGFWVARELQESGHSVTIFTVGEESSPRMNKPPYNHYSKLREVGVQTVWGEPSAIATVLGDASFNVVIENAGKDLDTVKPGLDWAENTGVEQYLFLSSAGIYKTSDELPHVEGDPVKADASHVKVEEYLQHSSKFKSWASFRPQYMIGYGNNKEAEEWFFDRIVRGRPVPIPAPGVQVTNVAHVRDVSSMLTLAVEKPEAANQKIFNIVSDRAVTFDGLVRLAAKAVGKEADILHYDPKAVGVDAKKAFLYRNQHFYAEPRAAKELLGWTSKTNLAEDLKERFEEYVASGRDKKELTFELDDKIIAQVRPSW